MTALLDTWAELVAEAATHHHTTRSLAAAGALRAPAPLVARLARVMVLGGYPDACASPGALGAALRSCAGKVAPDGRRLARTAAGRWYVVPA